MKKISLIAKWVLMPLNIGKSCALNGRSINLQSSVEKRSAVQAIETSFKIILLCDIFYSLNTSEKKVSVHYEPKQRKKFNKSEIIILFFKCLNFYCLLNTVVYNI